MCKLLLIVYVVMTAYGACLVVVLISGDSLLLQARQDAMQLESKRSSLRYLNSTDITHLKYMEFYISYESATGADDGNSSGIAAALRYGKFRDAWHRHSSRRPY